MTLFRSLASTMATNSGRARFVLRASFLAIAPSLLIFGVLVALGIDTLRAPTGTLDPAFMVYSVLLAPVVETGAMLALAAVLARLLPRQHCRYCYSPSLPHSPTGLEATGVRS